MGQGLKNGYKSVPFGYYSHKTKAMFKRILLGSILLVSLVACKSKAKTARDYNNRIVNVESRLEPLIMKTENDVEKFLTAEEYDKVAAAGEKMEGIIQEKIDSLSKEPAPKVKEGEEFKAAYIKYFRFIKSMYEGYKKLGLAGSQEEREAVIADVQTILAEREKTINDLQSAQRTFAAANGFTMEAAK